MPALVELLRQAPDDGLTARLVWAHLRPLLDQHGSAYVEAIQATDVPPHAREVVARAYRWILQLPTTTPADAAVSVSAVLDSDADAATARDALTNLVDRWLTADSGTNDAWQSVVVELCRAAAAERGELADFGELAEGLETESWDAVLARATDRDRSVPERMRAIRSVAKRSPARAATWAHAWIANALSDENPEMRQAGLAWVSSLSDPALGPSLLTAWHEAAAADRPAIMEVLTGRQAWGETVLSAIESEQLPPSALNVNQVRKLMATGDDAWRERIASVWGTLRDERDPRREAVIAQTRSLLQAGWGDPVAGRLVFDRVCGTCHQLHGTGAQVGPELTGNGRGAFDQLLSNVLDPSLVIGASYQATLVETDDGQVVTGLVIEDSPNRLVLKTQGDAVITLRPDQILERRVSPLSLMPENLESSVTEQELRDLFALLVLDGPADDPNSTHIAGSLESMAGRSHDPRRMKALLSCVLPGFECDKVGEGELELLAESQGRRGAVRVHPISEEEPCRVFGRVFVPAGDSVAWVLPVGRDMRGDWELEIKVDGATLERRAIDQEVAPQGWTEVTVDLTPMAGKEVEVEILCHANNWSWEFAFLGRARWVVEGSE